MLWVFHFDPCTQSIMFSKQSGFFLCVLCLLLLALNASLKRFLPQYQRAACVKVWDECTERATGAAQRVTQKSLVSRHPSARPEFMRGLVFTQQEPAFDSIDCYMLQAFWVCCLFYSNEMNHAGRRVALIWFWIKKYWVELPLKGKKT